MVMYQKTEEYVSPDYINPEFDSMKMQWCVGEL